MHAELCALVDETARNMNVFLAFEATGDFALMHTRSVPAQTKPYRPLAEITANQSEFRMERIRGTLVGFRSPAFAKGINVPGYHTHFISEDRKKGGHVLDFQLLSGELRLCEIRGVTILLPDESASFASLDLDKDRTKELHDVESRRAP